MPNENWELPLNQLRLGYQIWAALPGIQIMGRNAQGILETRPAPQALIIPAHSGVCEVRWCGVPEIDRRGGLYAQVHIQMLIQARNGWVEMLERVICHEAGRLNRRHRGGGRILQRATMQIQCDWRTYAGTVSFTPSREPLPAPSGEHFIDGVHFLNMLRGINQSEITPKPSVNIEDENAADFSAECRHAMKLLNRFEEWKRPLSEIRGYLKGQKLFEQLPKCYRDRLERAV